MRNLSELERELKELNQLIEREKEKTKNIEVIKRDPDFRKLGSLLQQTNSMEFTVTMKIVLNEDFNGLQYLYELEHPDNYEIEGIVKTISCRNKQIKQEYLETISSLLEDYLGEIAFDVEQYQANRDKVQEILDRLCEKYDLEVEDIEDML